MTTPSENENRSKFTPEQLAEILRLHKMWRRGEQGGARADLAGADLAGADLARANLAGADLARADLAGADLAGADLARANLAGADLARADLAGADLAGADLAGAYLADADLAGADLAGAYLADANLAGAYLARADLAGADLAGTYLARAKGLTNPPPDPPTPYVRPTVPEEVKAARQKRMLDYRARFPEVPVIEALDAKILAAITSGGGSLEMSSWHAACGTTHCRGGWAINFGGEKGAALEREHGSQRAATMIYRASTGRAPHFFASNERALEDIRACAAEQTGEVQP